MKERTSGGETVNINMQLLNMENNHWRQYSPVLDKSGGLVAIATRICASATKKSSLMA